MKNYFLISNKGGHMFILLLLSLFATSLIAALIVHKIFGNSIKKILKELFNQDIYEGWYKYIIFAIYVISWTSGSRIWQINQYIETGDSSIPLTNTRFAMELYDGLMQSFQGVIWLLFVFFLFAMIAFVIVKIFTKKTNG